MADKTETNKDMQKQEDNARLREDLSNAYAALVGEQSVKSFYNYTFEDAMQAQVDRIQGPSTKLRPNLMDRIDSIEAKVVQSANQIKQQPPEAFVEKDSTKDVNTPKEQAENPYP